MGGSKWRGGFISVILSKWLRLARDLDQYIISAQNPKSDALTTRLRLALLPPCFYLLDFYTFAEVWQCCCFFLKKMGIFIILTMSIPSFCDVLLERFTYQNNIITEQEIIITGLVDRSQFIQEIYYCLKTFSIGYLINLMVFSRSANLSRY